MMSTAATNRRLSVGHPRRPTIASPRYWRRRTGGLLLALAGAAAVVALDRDFSTLLGGAAGVAPEYELGEQFSKLCLFMAFLLNCLSVRAAGTRTEAALTIMVLIWTVSLYFGESNFLDSNLRIVWAAILPPLISWRLWRSARLFGLCAFGLSLLCVGAGQLADFAADGEVPNLLAPLRPLLFAVAKPLYAFWDEEHYDTVAAAIYAYFAFGLAEEPLVALISRHRYAILLFGAAALLIAIGNSLVHWQYEKPKLQETIGLLTALMGFLLIVTTNESLAKGDRLRLVWPTVLYALVFAAFVFLPVVFESPQNNYVLLILYGTAAIGGGAWLYRHHPSRGRRGSWVRP